MSTYASVTTNNSANTWYTWNGSTTSATTIDSTWTNWIAGTETIIFRVNPNIPAEEVREYLRTGRPIPVSAGNGLLEWPPQETEEQRQQREQLEEQQRIAHEERLRLARELEAERQQQLKEANDRAEELLRSNLTEDQLKVYLAQGYIPVIAQSGRHYRIKKGTSRNVDELEGDKRIAQWCVVPSGVVVPAADQWLAQKLMLEMNEEAFRSIGIRTAVQ